MVIPSLCHISLYATISWKTMKNMTKGFDGIGETVQGPRLLWWTDSGNGPCNFWPLVYSLPRVMPIPWRRTGPLSCFLLTGYSNTDQKHVITCTWLRDYITLGCSACLDRVLSLVALRKQLAMLGNPTWLGIESDLINSGQLLAESQQRSEFCQQHENEWPWKQILSQLNLKWGCSPNHHLACGSVRPKARDPVRLCLDS